MGRGKGSSLALHVEYERICSNHACLFCKPWPIRERGMKEGLGFEASRRGREKGVHV
jgi:hypothetical protein